MSADRSALLRLVLLLAAIATCAVTALTLVGCPSGPPAPAPVTPPAPSPVPDPPPAPEPGPAATPCERACARADELVGKDGKPGCDGAGGPQCPEACERYERMGGAFARNPKCQAKARTCAEHRACRSGSP